MPRQTKRQKDFAEIEKIKERLRHETSESLKKRLHTGMLTKAGAIAIREVLAERNETPDK